MRGAGHADVLLVLQMPGNKADAVPCERLPFLWSSGSHSDMIFSRSVIALEAHLRNCRNVTVLGVKPNFSDYSRKAASQIIKADKIYFPSLFYADMFDAIGKKTFPSYHTYKCAQDKIRQSALFALAQIPHPPTRVFYGKRQKSKIIEFFKYPFVGKIPTGSAMGRGVYLIHNNEELFQYCSMTHAAYIQAFFPVDRDIRVVVIGSRAVHAYWRIARPGEFRSNVAVGGTISLETVPKEALDLARHTARVCGWDNVGIDICCYNGDYYVIEGNMKYGKEGFRCAGIDYFKLMERLIDDGTI
jgi:ribosomal protein S6--L-glutamate ligase